jgi:hypothetical protein
MLTEALFEVCSFPWSFFQCVQFISLKSGSLDYHWHSSCICRRIKWGSRMYILLTMACDATFLEFYSGSWLRQKKLDNLTQIHI